MARATLAGQVQRSTVAARLFKEYWEFRLADEPELATLVGRTEYDDRWRDWSPVARQRARQQLQNFRVNLNTCRPEQQVRYNKEALLLHEGVPGHHLQASIALEIEDLPEFKMAMLHTMGPRVEKIGDSTGPLEL